MTVFFNAVLWGIISVFSTDILSLFLSFAFLFFGLAITLPLLALIVPLVHVSVKSPYPLTAKLIGLGFWLAAIIISFFTLIFWITKGNFFDMKLQSLSVVAVIGLVLSLLIAKSSFAKFDTYCNKPIN